jgi:16S rRNA (guanine966-N2)-methyltransferase
MRVIAGSARGRRLIAPETAGTRPLSDRAREGIFSALGNVVEDVDVLDLYAGSGSIGIEALSRGARHVVFVEQGPKALTALRQNLDAIGFRDSAQVVSQSVESYLGRLTDSFHLFFFDPPWSMPTELVASQMMTAASHAEPEAEIVVHRRRPDPLPILPPGWIDAGIYRYGDSVLYRVSRA